MKDKRPIELSRKCLRYRSIDIFLIAIFMFYERNDKHICVCIFYSTFQTVTLTVAVGTPPGVEETFVMLFAATLSVVEFDGMLAVEALAKLVVETDAILTVEETPGKAVVDVCGSGLVASGGSP